MNLALFGPLAAYLEFAFKIRVLKVICDRLFIHALKIIFVGLCVSKLNVDASNQQSNFKKQALMPGGESDT